MGKASSDRGSMMISRQYCSMSGCRGCSRCSEYIPTPRSPTWGEKTAARALKKARGILAFNRRRGRQTTAENLADMVQCESRFTTTTATRAALWALHEETS